MIERYLIRLIRKALKGTRAAPKIVDEFPQRLITSMADLPDENQNPKFWEFINDPNYKQNIMLLIMNSLRKYDPCILTPEQKTNELAKLKAFQELFDLQSTLMSYTKEEQTPQEPTEEELLDQFEYDA